MAWVGNEEKVFCGSKNIAKNLLIIKLCILRITQKIDYSNTI